jgi:hypothetical protein
VARVEGTVDVLELEGLSAAAREWVKACLADIGLQPSAAWLVRARTVGERNRLFVATDAGLIVGDDKADPAARPDRPWTLVLHPWRSVRDPSLSLDSHPGASRVTRLMASIAEPYFKAEAVGGTADGRRLGAFLVECYRRSGSRHAE